MKSREKIYLFIFVWLLFLIPSVASAAILYFEPAGGNFNLGDEFMVDVKLDIGDSCINALEAEIDMAGDAVRLMDFSAGSSFFALWITRPAQTEMDEINRSGKLSFSGGIPGGYCGKIPGDPGVSNVVGTLVFKIPSFSVSASGSNRLGLSFNAAKTRALKNDGVGTADALITKEAEFFVSPSGALPLNEWQSILKNDTIPPEPFVIEILKDPNLFDNKYYVVFSTTDKQSGLDRYEVLEIKPGEEVGVAPAVSWLDRLFKRPEAAPAWQSAVMPYVLKDQDLASIIKVKAVDKAGNERIVEYVPPLTAAKPEAPRLYLGIIAAIVLFTFLAALSLIIIIKRRKNGKTKAI
jgi:hypothetical protein